MVAGTAERLGGLGSAEVEVAHKTAAMSCSSMTISSRFSSMEPEIQRQKLFLFQSLSHPQFRVACRELSTSLLIRAGSARQMSHKTLFDRRKTLSPYFCSITSSNTPGAPISLVGEHQKIKRYTIWPSCLGLRKPSHVEAGDDPPAEI